MFALYILNGSCTLDKKHALIFPGLSETSEPPVSVSAISVDGEFLFNLVDIAYVITGYKNGKVGNTIHHIRQIVTEGGGRRGFGKVLWFRRGGIYADICALQSIARLLFSDDENACAFSKITYHAAYGALMTCPVQAYKGFPVQGERSFSIDDFVRIQPHSFEVNRFAISGVPMPDNEEEIVQEESKEAVSEDKVPKKVVEVLSVPADKSAKVVESQVAARFDGLYAFDKLLSMLVGGRKIVLTLEVK